MEVTTKNFNYEKAITLDLESSSDTEYRETVNRNIGSALDYLNEFQDAVLLINDQEAYEALFYIAKKLARSMLVVDLNLLVEKNCCELYSKLLLYLNFISSKLDFSKDVVVLDNANTNTTLDERRTSIFGCITYSIYMILNKLMDCKFANRFQNNHGIDSLILFLKDTDFLNRNLNLNINPIGAGDIGIIDELVFCLEALSQISDDFKQIWHELDAINVLFRVSSLKEAVYFNCYRTIANIANDQQLEEISNINDTIFLKLIEKFYKYTHNYRTHQIQLRNLKIFEDNKFKTITTHFISDKKGSKIPTYTILNCLYKLVLNDKLKLKLFYNTGFRENLKESLPKINQSELKYILAIIAQLTFNEKICKELRKDKQLLQLMNDIINEPKNTNAPIKNICHMINWNLFNKELRLNEFKKNQKDPIEYFKHVLFSYSSENKDLIIKLKNRFETMGYQIYLNQNETINFEEMTTSVEDSYVVVMCIDEKYRQNIYTQIEARYAYELQKPIIPFILQKDYENVRGWLSGAIKNKKCVTYYKLDFDESIKMLKYRLDMLESSVLNSQSTMNDKNEMFKRKKLPEHMNESEVNEWFINKNIDPLIEKFLKTCACDGQMLQQIYFMKINDPQFFNHSFKSVKDLNFMSLIKFSVELDKLFKNDIEDF